MSGLGYLERLLDGAAVEWLPLASIAGYSETRIGFQAVDKSNYVGVDNLVQNRGGRVESNYVPTSGNLTEYREGDILIGNIRPYLRKIWLADRSGGTNGDVLVVNLKSPSISPSYLYQVLSDEKFFEYNIQHSKGAKMPRGSKSDILQYLIPIPCPEDPQKSLAIQGEIVRILDAFTALTAELTAELTARKTQYNHYRNQLLSFDGGDVEWKTLGEVFHLRAGQHISATGIEKEASDSHAFPCFGGNGVRGYVQEKSHVGDFLLIGRQGALCGNVQRAKGAFYATEHAVVVRATEAMNVDWAYHYLTIMNLNQYASQGSLPGLAVGNLQNLKIPVPSLAEQARIANILDTFDTLTTSLSEGLPREIALRQKQYEYYRNLLLSFPKGDKA
ncbi:restriction endonuclease subunit S [Marivivens sp. LCG002]|uniref:restriction endonuclease subunit S n=1 Tax=Marivivens sp. LCG002 TaxID=3051171 RepID=UPI0025535BE0|nr:restriction endonuclease subunit S [Marivivens sp. LCG002]WIV52065.1 restriction endonuclease subunit S [Marivivens sp. LCG002]